MPAKSQSGRGRGAAHPASPLAPDLRWRRIFTGHERELPLLRQWLASLLPQCPARSDVLSVATELAANAVRHTASGCEGGRFAVEITWHPAAVLIAVADGGGPAEPHVIDDPLGESGRGLLLVRGLSARTGFTGDTRGRLVWAQVPWDDPTSAAHPPAQDPYEAAIRDGEAALARRFSGVPAWFGRSTLTWWAMAGPQGLVSAPTARDLAGLLYRLAEAPPAAQPSVPGRVSRSSAGEEAGPNPHRRSGGDGAARRGPGKPARTGLDLRAPGFPARARRPFLVASLAASAQL